MQYEKIRRRRRRKRIDEKEKAKEGVNVSVDHGWFREAHGYAAVVCEEAVRAPRVHLRRGVWPMHLPRETLVG